MPPIEPQGYPAILPAQGVTIPAEAPEFGFSMHGLLTSLNQSRVFIILCAAVGLLAGIGLAFLPRHYTAVSRVQVRTGSSSQYRLDQPDLGIPADESTILETESSIIESDTLLLDVANKLHLGQNLDFMGWSTDKNLDPNDPRTEEVLLRRLHTNIHATRIPHTEIIQVSCNSRSGMLSARIVNTIVAEYIQELFERRLASTNRVSKWLTSQLNDLKLEVERDEDDLLTIQSRLGIVGVDQNHNIVVTELEDLTKAADDARVGRIIAEARYRILNNGDSNLIEGGQDILGATIPNNPQLSLLSNLRDQKAATESKLAGLTAQFGPNYPEVQQVSAELATLNREIEQEQARVLNQAHQALDAATTDEQKTFATLQDKKSQAFRKQSDMIQYQILLHDYESSRALYEGLVQRLREAGIVAGLDSSEVDIVDMARVPGRPSEMGRLTAAALGLVFGLALGVAGAFFMSQFDQRAQDLSTIESLMGIPLLSVTPALDAPIDTIDSSFARSTSPFLESMWQLRGALLLSNSGQGPRKILFTSCNLGEGSTTIACAQACALALRDARVLLIDGDMRRPAVMRLFGLSNEVGLSSVLSETTSAERSLQAVKGIPNLAVMTSGPVPASAPLLLSAERMRTLLGPVMQKFDFILIDSPPFLGLVDSSSLAQFSDAVVLVSSYAKLKRPQVTRVAKVLNRIGRSIVGVALNFADSESMSSYGYSSPYRTLKKGDRA